MGKSTHESKPTPAKIQMTETAETSLFLSEKFVLTYEYKAIVSKFAVYLATTFTVIFALFTGSISENTSKPASLTISTAAISLLSEIAFAAS